MEELSTLAFDYVIIGAGSAGCVLANRLSADPSIRVALVEAGPSDRRWPTNLKTALPIGNVFLLPHARYNWQYEYRGGDSVKGRAIPCPRGKLLGGSSSLNGAVYIRGQREDYDDWAALGNMGWGYDEVLPAFMRHENWHGEPSIWHGQGGELDSGRPPAVNPLTNAFLAAVTEAGYALNPDPNGATQEGFGILPVNQRDGIRMSSSRAFLGPILHRANLQVFEETMAERILFDGRRATGVMVKGKGGRAKLRAAHEVILAGGAINSPQLLMLSGVGPAEHLLRLGIRPIHDLPGVGANLHDHPTVAVAMTNPTRESYALNMRALPRLAFSPIRYLVGRRGILASNAVESGGFLSSPLSPGRPDIQMGLLVGLKDSAKVIPRRHGCILAACALRPHSRGTLSLASPDPRAKPLLDYDMLSDERDTAVLVHALKEARRIVAAPSLARYLGEELSPGATRTTDEALTEAIRSGASTSYHPAGTCRMGPDGDTMAVVDPMLRVRGIEGLRVVDASIMPQLISGNTSAPVMMIAERASDFILSNCMGGLAA